MNYHLLDIVFEAENKKWSEDSYVFQEDIVCVLDGATPIKKTEFEGYGSYSMWLVNDFIKYFLSNYDIKHSVPQLVDISMKEIKKKYPLTNLSIDEKPTFTFISTYISEGQLICNYLGDCCGYILCKNDEIIQLYDNRIEQFSNKTLQQLQYAKANNLDISLYMTNQKRENIRSRNSNGGFWVVGYEGDFMKEFIQSEIPIQNIKSILLCSDGFNRIFNEFKLFQPIDILNRSISLNDAYMKLRKHETENSHNIYYPCVKAHDDVTAVLFKITP